MNSVKSIALIAMLSMGTAKAAIIDLELSLVVDISGSVNSAEYNLQMDGYAAAFRDLTIQDRIANSINGLAVNVIFFASNAAITTLDAFTILTNAAEANLFANLLDSFARPTTGSTAVGGTTSTQTGIGNGINRAVELLNGNGLDGTFGGGIDVSGDGSNNFGIEPKLQSDLALAAGYTVNGLAIGPGLVPYYTSNVITSNGFVVEAADFNDFTRAAIQKIELETRVIQTPEPSMLAFLALGLLFISRKKFAK
jgi:hypothetical protein